LPARFKGQFIVAVTSAVNHRITVALAKVGARGRFEPIGHFEIADKESAEAEGQ
jgi:hypothetical protein